MSNKNETKPANRPEAVKLAGAVRRTTTEARAALAVVFLFAAEVGPFTADELVAAGYSAGDSGSAKVTASQWNVTAKAAAVVGLPFVREVVEKAQNDPGDMRASVAESCRLIVNDAAKTSGYAVAMKDGAVVVTNVATKEPAKVSAGARGSIKKAAQAAIDKAAAEKAARKADKANKGPAKPVVPSGQSVYADAVALLTEVSGRISASPELTPAAVNQLRKDALSNISAAVAKLAKIEAALGGSR